MYIMHKYACTCMYFKTVFYSVHVQIRTLFHLKQYKTKLTISTMINVTTIQLQDITSPKIQLDKSCRNSTRPSPPTQAVALLDSLGRFRQTSLKSWTPVFSKLQSSFVKLRSRTCVRAQHVFQVQLAKLLKTGYFASTALESVDWSEPKNEKNRLIARI